MSFSLQKWSYISCSKEKEKGRKRLIWTTKIQQRWVATCNTSLSDNNATTSSGICAFLLYCYVWKVWSQRKHFSSTEVRWFSPGLVFRLYSWPLIVMLSRTGESLYMKYVPHSKQICQKHECLWGKWIWQVFTGENGEKMADDQKVTFSHFSKRSFMPVGISLQFGAL